MGWMPKLNHTSLRYSNRTVTVNDSDKAVAVLKKVVHTKNSGTKFSMYLQA